MCIFVDIQGFRGNDKSFVIKEIAIYKSGVLSTNTFEPPYSYNSLENKYKKQSIWLYYNHHRLSWNEGYIPYSRVKDVIYKELVIKNIRDSIIYVKGEEKTKWLQDICNVPAINIETLKNCPNLKSMENCPIKIELNNMSFAEKNALKLFGWYNFNFK